MKVILNLDMTVIDCADAMGSQKKKKVHNFTDKDSHNFATCA